jgi:prepilin-type N-terminal cleavage/methylation domain-containing protein
MKKFQFGFTLIELVIVVAIIGLLAAIVLSSLNISRDKGYDAAIKSNLKNVKSQSEIVYANFGCYTNAGNCSGLPSFPAGVCPSSGSDSSIFSELIISAQLATARNAAGGGGFESCASVAGGAGWAVAVTLKTDNKQAWCVDSEGTAKQISNGTNSFDQDTLNTAIAGAVCP